MCVRRRCRKNVWVKVRKQMPPCRSITLDVSMRETREYSARTPSYASELAAKESKKNRLVKVDWFGNFAICYDAARESGRNETKDRSHRMS